MHNSPKEAMNLNGNGNVVATRAEDNANGNNGNQIRCYNCRGLGHLARNCTVRPRRRDAAYLQTQLLIAQKWNRNPTTSEEFDLMADAIADLDEIDEVNANCIFDGYLQQDRIEVLKSEKAPVYDSDGSAEVQLHDNCYDDEILNMFTQEEQYTELLEPIPEPLQVLHNDSNVTSVASSVEQGGGTVEQHPANVKETQAAKFVRDFQSLANEDDESLTKHKALELEIERLLRAVNKLHDMIYENAKLRPQLFDKVSEEKDTTRGTSVNTKFAKQSILGKPPSFSRPKLYAITPLPKFTAFPKVGEINALFSPNMSSFQKLGSFLQESNIMKNDNVLSLRIFRINPFKASRVENFVPNKHVKPSVRTKPITVSQPHVITKNDVNSKTNGFSPKDVKSTTRTRRPLPRNNPKNDKGGGEENGRLEIVSLCRAVGFLEEWIGDGWMF
ncbi:retrovirus-related pol polyprotein from transposon TNT 1-94 [Tanacetum coccineum]